MRQIPRTASLIEPALRSLIGLLLGGAKPWPLFLCGPAGRGKTCAALAILDRVEIIYRIPDCDAVICYQSVWYGTVEDLVQMVLSRDDERWREIGAAALVVIDELGLRSSDSDLEYIALKRAADLREFSPTVWISNQEPEGIRRLYDDRIYSRICSGTWYKVGGADRRFA